MSVNTGSTEAFGAILNYDQSGTSAPSAKITSPTALAGIINISLDSSRDTIEETDHQSTGGFREFMAGLIDGGSLNLELNMEQANYNILKAAHQAAPGAAGARHQFEIQIPNIGTSTDEYITFLAIVTSLSVGLPHDGKVTCNATLKVSGKPFHTAAT
ncbi:MAG: hypothetical protein KDA21_15705 [Phycisphaerales bacterium]|nr:hypothetical protein [Phycisphaerales bacterium]